MVCNRLLNNHSEKEILDKDTIDKYILANLSVGLRERESNIELMREAAGLILYRLKQVVIGDYYF
jgi:hypothetical protein